MNKLIITLIIASSISITSVYGQSIENSFDKTLYVTDDNMTYEIPYSMDNGIINDAILNCKDATLSLFMNTDERGILILDFPNNLFHSIFMLFVDGEEFTDGVSIEDDILTINYPKNTKNIEIWSSFDLIKEKNDGVCEDGIFKYVGDDPVKKIFVIDGYEIISNSSAVSEILLDWDSPHLPEGEIILEYPINGTVKLEIPKEMPRMVNLSFGSSIVLLESDDYLYGDISETASECSYILLATFKNNDRIKFASATLATGNWETVSIMDQACGNYTLKQQIENNIPSHEINCRNEQQYVFDRPNGEIACVEFSTGEKLGWSVVPDY